MWKLAALLAVITTAACTSEPAPSNPAPAGVPAIELPGGVDGVSYTGMIAWTDDDGDGGGSGLGGFVFGHARAIDHADADAGTFTVLALTCDGCTLTQDPTGTSSAVAVFDYRPTTAGPITVTAKVSWDADGTESSASLTIQGDREVAVGATCYLIPQASVGTGTLIDAALCGKTRTSDQAVLIAPVIDTEGGSHLEPGTADVYHGAPADSDFAFAPVTAAWIADFALLGDVGSATAVDVSARLATGETVHTSVAIPPLAP